MLTYSVCYCIWESDDGRRAGVWLSPCACVCGGLSRCLWCWLYFKALRISSSYRHFLPMGEVCMSVYLYRVCVCVCVGELETSDGYSQLSRAGRSLPLFSVTSHYSWFVWPVSPSSLHCCLNDNHSKDTPQCLIGKQNQSFFVFAFIYHQKSPCFITVSGRGTQYCIRFLLTH